MGAPGPVAYLNKGEVRTLALTSDPASFLSTLINNKYKAAIGAALAINLGQWAKEAQAKGQCFRIAIVAGVPVGDGFYTGGNCK